MLFAGLVVFALLIGLVAYGIAIDECTCLHCGLPLSDWDGCQNPLCKANQQPEAQCLCGSGTAYCPLHNPPLSQL
jgi:hypothetical protein